MYRSQQLSAPQITAHATQGDDTLCVDAMSMFCALLGTQAANLALTLARGGIYIGGGIVPQLGEFFVRSPFSANALKTKGAFLLISPTHPDLGYYSPLSSAAGRCSVFTHVLIQSGSLCVLARLFLRHNWALLKACYDTRENT